VVNTVASATAEVVVQAHTVNDGVHIHRAPRQPVALPYRSGIVPPRAASFQDRDASTLIAGTGDATSVVSGLGGVGKTQMAVDFAETAWAAGELDLLVWVTAGSREAIHAGYATAAAALTAQEESHPEQGARRFLEWLATTTIRWLVVLDDLERPADLVGLWPPRNRSGRVVVTTRRRDAALRGHQRQMVEVGVFSPDEANTYLATALADQPRLLDGAAELAAELGFLPLALAQAGAYLLDRDLSGEDYRRRWTDRARTLAALLPEPEALPDEHRVTVAATWSLSVELAQQLTPVGVAAPLLEIASMLDPNGAPTVVFTSAPVLGLLCRRLGREVDGEQAQDGLRCLHRLSLLTLDTRSVRVHAVVQRVVRDSLPPEEVAVVARTVADALVEVWPEVDRDRVLGQVLRANTAALHTVAEEHLWVPDCHAVLFWAGRSLGESGAVGDAVEYFHRQHTLALRYLGPDHCETLFTRHDLAYWQGHSGDPVGAATAFTDLLADQLRTLGPDHADTLLTRHDVAYWRGHSGDALGAVSAFEAVLADRLRVLGPDHVDTLITRHDLAQWRAHAGDPTAAVSAFEEVLLDQLRLLGPDHPQTLITRHDLAHWRVHIGAHLAAAAEFASLLADQSRVLGPDHHLTLLTRAGLANSLGRLGDPVGATAEFVDLLADHVRALGPNHPQTQTTRRHLAHWQNEAKINMRT
jgi:hypothetical protein